MTAFSMTIALAAIVTVGPFGLVQLTTTPNGGLALTACPAPLESGSIATIAGTGRLGSDGDGGPAIEADIAPSVGIAVDQAGNVYFSETYPQSAVRRIGTDGIITTVASPATGADLVLPQGLAFGQDGSLYVSDTGAGHIWRVEDDGTTTAVVGTGVEGTSGNEGLALEAEVQPVELAIGPRGDMYFDDLNNYRRVDAEGVIHAFAGSTEPGFSGDGGPATEAALESFVVGIATDAAGNVYLGDPGNRRIRKVDAAGTITTVAGTGDPGSSGDGDGGPALEANLADSPYGLALDAEGALYVSERQRNTVRKIDPSGIMTTVVGGTAELGDCGPASEASVATPQGVAVHDGVLYINDAGHNRIRMVVP